MSVFQNVMWTIGTVLGLGGYVLALLAGIRINKLERTLRNHGIYP